jgi:hypothetical protein
MCVGETLAGSQVRGRQSQEWGHRAHRPFRAGIRALLQSVNDIEIVPETGDRSEALRLVASHRPDVPPRGWLVVGRQGSSITVKGGAQHGHAHEH